MRNYGAKIIFLACFLNCTSSGKFRYANWAWSCLVFLAVGGFGFCPFPDAGFLLEMGVRTRFEIADSKFQILKGLGGLTGMFVAMSL